MSIKPLGDRVVLKRLASEQKTAGGVILPDSAQEKPLQGEVIAVGSGKLLENGKRSQIEVSVGQKVLFGKYSGTEVKIDGQEVVILDQKEILGVYE
ncbi:MAG: co-chaperone GroES [bacterium]|nr:co-chaperone GroES [bacterium]